MKSRFNLCLKNVKERKNMRERMLKRKRESKLVEKEC